ncbi:hypothetical protein ACT4S2_02685 [Kocuria turfanensis]|uniref:hypothetical protein n=1 Tax=Kocuria turfanensis TaxID=388357 RepID=UPI004035CDCB
MELAHVDVLWDRLEPEHGQIDDDYASDLATSVRTCQDAGIRVILGLGLQYAPGWARELRDGKLLDQAGNAHPGQTPNIVFSDAVRRAFAEHASNVLDLLPKDAVYAIRLGTSEAGELGYPRSGQNEGVSDPSFWAFDNSAQTGEHMPAGLQRTPLPGWKPGDTTWRGRTVTARDVATWFEWYSEATVNAVLWQADVLRASGFFGTFHVPLAGQGTLPDDLRQAITAKLDGVADPDGSLERGLYYPHQTQALKRWSGEGGLVADVTSLDDVTAVQARSRRPPTDSCSPTDYRMDLEAHPEVRFWSSARWTIANARRAGLQVIGENPGSPHATSTGGHEKSDDLREQMKHAPAYAAECGLSAFLWAFEEDLFSKPEYLGLEDYRKTIASYR